jgi:two-component system sensor histidine kinase TctE
MDVVQDSVPHAIEKQIDLGYEGAQPNSPGVRIMGNLTLIKELVRNLVDNALSYTPTAPDRPGVVTARVLIDVVEQVALVQVEDNGNGIAPAERDLVFQPFYRTLGTEADGSGLGLSIVQRIAQQYQAVMTIEDAKPHLKPTGCLFSVRFKALQGADKPAG